MKKIEIFINGAIGETLIAKEIAALQSNKKVGAHAIFIGQVRNDTIQEKEVVAIKYSAYEDMAYNNFIKIIEDAKSQFSIEEIIIKHSLQNVKCGEICLFVLVATAHRNEAYEASRFVVEAIKKQVPVFGKEIFADETYVWKENKI
jgi:molybdopterin synthase catalytic subunit